MAPPTEGTLLWLVAALLAAGAGYFLTTGLLQAVGDAGVGRRGRRAPSALRRALGEAGLAAYPTGRVLLAALAAGLLSALVVYYAGRDVPVLTAGAAGAGPFLLWLLLRRHHRRLREERHDALIDAADLVGRALTAGLSMQDAIGLVRTDGPAALQAEIGRVIQAVGHGRQTWPAALRQLRQRLDDRFADDMIDLLIQGVTEGATGVGPSLTSLVAQEVTADGLRREILADQAGTHTGVLMVVGMIVALFVALRWLNPDYLRPYDTPEGQVVLALVGLAVALIYLAMRRLGRLDDDPLAPATEELERGEGRP
ncbi:MAG: hypothetical protein IT340_22160 [Chloroflexi bacterium]|nr:hypothetical protein [Chloroflexota bacterium]